MQAIGGPGEPRGRNVHYGVREHAMCAIVNGMVAVRPAGIRLGLPDFHRLCPRRDPAFLADGICRSCISGRMNSISLGEDGPTHQPIEQLVSLRAIPGMVVIRPADANETAEAYRCILGFQDRPAALICSRQPLPTIDRQEYAAASGLAKGAYVLADGPGEPAVILIATGSEVVAMPCRTENCSPRNASQPALSACRPGSCSRRRTASLSRQRAAAGYHRARDRRGRRNDRLGSLCRPRGHRPRHAQLRHVGADQGGGGAFRLHRHAWSPSGQAAIQRAHLRSGDMRMQLGMIGLGRMGANMVERLMRRATSCVVSRRSTKPPCRAWLGKGAKGSTRPAEFIESTPTAARRLADAAGRRGRFRAGNS